MGTVATPPEFLRDSDSIVAPLLIGYLKKEGGPAPFDIVLMASVVIPEVTIMRKHLVGRKAVAAPHTRMVVPWHDANEAKGYKIVARSCVLAPGETRSQGFARWDWEVGVFSFKQGQYAGLMPEGRNIVRLDVTRYRLLNQGVIAAQQLALFRHMMVESFLGLDPTALVFGGQREWRREWWPNPVPPAAQ